jgi:choline-glycine betaine transporter
MSRWTLFYWGWWIAWSPFVGLFLARISRGRTIREFLFGVLVLPTAITFFWLTVFGETALMRVTSGDQKLADLGAHNVSAALFELLGGHAAVSAKLNLSAVLSVCLLCHFERLRLIGGRYIGLKRRTRPTGVPENILGRSRRGRRCRVATC